MYLTPDNAVEYVGKELDAKIRMRHYYPLTVIQLPNGDVVYRDAVGVHMRTSCERFNQPYFDIVDGIETEE